MIPAVAILGMACIGAAIAGVTRCCTGWFIGFFWCRGEFCLRNTGLAETHGVCFLRFAVDILGWKTGSIGPLIIGDCILEIDV